MTKSIFITGTGTDIGKTYVSALIAKKLSKSNTNVSYYKPALSGAIKTKTNLIAGDAYEVFEIAGLKGNPNSNVSYILETPVSPHLASKMEGVSIDLDKILMDYKTISKQHEYLIVEGCGGIICPINSSPKLMLTDIIKTLDLDIIIVADASLGTINSSLLTINHAKNLGLNIKGIILNRFDKNNFLHIDNKIQIQALSDIPVIACVGTGDSEIDIDIEFLKSLYKEVF
ncbi:MAG: dethiobiotin synthase [Tissierellales bacterium]|jgi:dethiobiotin synthetase|nr:dethiobiotin synthase [Tissierellales bacterium]